MCPVGVVCAYCVCLLCVSCVLTVCGLVSCVQVAQAVCDAANENIKKKAKEGEKLQLWRRPRFNKRAMKKTFMARDNIHSFIMFAKDFGVNTHIYICMCVYMFMYMYTHTHTHM